MGIINVMIFHLARKDFPLLSKGVRKICGLVFLVSFCVSCSLAPVSDTSQTELFQAGPTDNDLLQAYAPVFLVEEADKPYNRIGIPGVLANRKNEPTIIVDPEHGALFAEKNDFKTAKGSYTNLVYRVHFEKVPFGLGNLHLTTGKNPGLFVILTLADNNDIILVTTVHTCGCYLVFFPTDSLQKDKLPANWPANNQWKFSMNLPSMIMTPEISKKEKLIITLNAGNHRVSDIRVESTENLGSRYNKNELTIMAMDSLRFLPYGNDAVSFFETHGHRKGYVKNNSKPLERLFMSWWTFDWHVGEDKTLGKRKEVGVIFYTSLKFWRRKESDMGDFARFLQYWGWNL